MLIEVGEIFSDQTLSASQQSHLKTIEDSCRGVPQEMQRVLEHYESPGTSSQRTWDRVRWDSANIVELRARLGSNILLLTAFIRFLLLIIFIDA